MTDNVENVNLEEKTAVPGYTLRPLRDEDLWPVLGIIAEVFPEDLAQYFVALLSGDKTFEEVGYDVGFKLFAAVIKNLPKMGDPMYDFLSNLSGIPAKEVAAKVGYNDYSNFFRAYKKITGHSPTQDIPDK